ncbi:MAG TPA: hypothetical protein VKZ53_24685 [Candidatus Angelobacter sp.]|nr:hypothetical protein [Candidatus Angelobacter sp.]
MTALKRRPPSGVVSGCASNRRIRSVQPVAKVSADWGPRGEIQERQRDRNSQSRVLAKQPSSFVSLLSRGGLFLQILVVPSQDLTRDFGPSRSGAVESAILHAQALDSRKAHITPESKRASLKHGRCAVEVPHTSGLQVTVR